MNVARVFIARVGLGYPVLCMGVDRPTSCGDGQSDSFRSTDWTAGNIRNRVSMLPNLCVDQALVMEVAASISFGMADPQRSVHGIAGGTVKPCSCAVYTMFSGGIAVATSH